MLSSHRFEVHSSLKVSIVLALLAVLAIRPAHAQQVAIPDTPAGQVLTKWLDAFNSGDRDRISAYKQLYEPAAWPSVDGYMSFRARTGELDLIGIHKSTPQYIEFVVKERAGTARNIGRLDVTNSNPPKVTNNSLRLIPQDAAVIGFEIDAAVRKGVISAAIAKLKERYIYPDMATKMEQALLSHQKRGDYDTITLGEKLAALLTAHLQEVSRDKHLRVIFSPTRFPAVLAAPDAEPTGEVRKSIERSNCGFEKVEHRLAGNVGYVKINGFSNPTLCADTASAAMNFLANVDSIIFDLRDNGGGDPRMVAYILSYLFDERTHLNDFWEPKKGVTRSFWTSSDVPGNRLTDVRAFVLTSPRTFSGGEEFAYDLKNLRRATIVGETTGGGAHPTRGERIDDRFIIAVPFARPINAVTQTNWEGNGVEPDVKVAANDALTTALKLAAERSAVQAP